MYAGCDVCFTCLYLLGCRTSGGLFCGFHNSEFTSGKNNSQYECGGICNRSCVHDTIDSKEEGEDDDQWQQEEYLPCEGHDHTESCFSHGGKKSGRHRLDSVGKSHQHEDSEIFFRKLKVQVASVSEDAYDLVREELETDKKYGCNHST